MNPPRRQLPTLDADKTACHDSRPGTEDRLSLIPHISTRRLGNTFTAHQAEEPSENDGIKHRPNPVQRARYDGHQDGH